MQTDEENEKKQKMIEEMTKKGKEIDEPDYLFENNEEITLVCEITSITSFLLAIAGLTLFAVNPSARAIIVRIEYRNINWRRNWFC